MAGTDFPGTCLARFGSVTVGRLRQSISDYAGARVLLPCPFLLVAKLATDYDVPHPLPVGPLEDILVNADGRQFQHLGGGPDLNKNRVNALIIGTVPFIGTL